MVYDFKIRILCGFSYEKDMAGRLRAGTSSAPVCEPGHLPHRGRQAPAGGDSFRPCGATSLREGGKGVR